MVRLKNNIILCIMLLSLLFTYRSFGQEIEPDTTTQPLSEGEVSLTEDEEKSDTLPEGPKGFRGIELGMHIDVIKEILLKDPYFAYKGDPDVSFLPAAQQVLIECPGNSFVQRAYFQFYNETLFIIIIELNQSKLDYYTMFTTLSGKYNESTSLDPTETVWIFTDVRLSLEKPLTIKYIDRKVFEELKTAGKVQEDIEERSRKEFLKDF